MSLSYNEIVDLVTEGKTDEEIVETLSLRKDWWRPLTSLEALRWLSKSGRMSAMEDALATAIPSNLKSAIKTTLIAVQRADASLDLSPSSDDRLLLLGCVAANIFTEGDVIALIESTRLRSVPTIQDVLDAKAAEAERIRRSEQRAAGEIGWQAWLGVHNAGGSDADAWSAFAAAQPVEA